MVENNTIELCYQRDDSPTIFLWSPVEKRTFLDIAPIGKDESKDAKPISDIVVDSSSDISKLITNPEGFCVQTGVENWKDITEYTP